MILRTGLALGLDEVESVKEFWGDEVRSSFLHFGVLYTNRNTRPVHFPLCYLVVNCSWDLVACIFTPLGLGLCRLYVSHVFRRIDRHWKSLYSNDKIYPSYSDLGSSLDLSSSSVLNIVSAVCSTWWYAGHRFHSPLFCLLFFLYVDGMLFCRTTKERLTAFSLIEYFKRTQGCYYLWLWRSYVKKNNYPLARAMIPAPSSESCIWPFTSKY